MALAVIVSSVVIGTILVMALVIYLLNRLNRIH
jgi:hypothetical protein